MEMNDVILWFRRDLRLSDNPALAAVLEVVKQSQARVLPIYIYSPDEEAPWEPGGASRWWLHQSLARLKQDLQSHGLDLYCFQGRSAPIIETLVEQTGAKCIFANRLYEPHLHERDAQLFKALSAKDIDLKLFDAGLLFTPGTVLNQQELPYKVFTPFWRNCEQRLDQCLPMVVQSPEEGQRIKAFTFDGEACSIDALGLQDTVPWHDKLLAHWQPGEAGAWARLEEFLEESVADYDEDRDKPAEAGTTRLSPHLHFGEITPGQILHSLLPQWHSADEKALKSIKRLVTELGWREFAHHVLWHFPQSSHQSLNPKFGDDFWAEDAAALSAWQQGNTGVPLVDAGMRQLWETGWMHNRVRMVVGSFLTKNLGIHWRHGAHWFWDTLVDANLANNSMGWQWVAGCGVDAAPYYRIFNPETQAKKFDPDGVYLDRWLDASSLKSPIVDLKQSRQAALDRYKYRMTG